MRFSCARVFLIRIINYIEILLFKKNPNLLKRFIREGGKRKSSLDIHRWFCSLRGEISANRRNKFSIFDRQILSTGFSDIGARPRYDPSIAAPKKPNPDLRREASPTTKASLHRRTHKHGRFARPILCLRNARPLYPKAQLFLVERFHIS